MRCMSDPHHPNADDGTGRPDGTADPDAAYRPGPPPNPYAHYTPVDRSAQKPGQAARSRKTLIWTIAATIAVAFTAFVAYFVISKTTAEQEMQAASEGVVWPGNMATGGIVFSGDMEPEPSDAPESGSFPQPAGVDRQNGPVDIHLYVDYRCPVCAVFEAANGEALEEAVTGGGATLEVHPLTFLDRVDEQDRYSSRAAGAVACVVDGQPEDAWDAHRHLLLADVQPSETDPGLPNDRLADELERATGGLSGETRSCIEEERFVPFAQALDSWTFGTPVPNAEDPELQVEGTPFAVVGGVPYEGSVQDEEAFRAFLEEQGVRF